MKKKTFKILLIFILFVSMGEIFLRILGFGDPVLYENSENYYPKKNQNLKRFKGVNLFINKLGMRTKSDWENIEHKYKILFFGDSVTFGGSYIDNEDLFSEKFCKLYQNSICGNYGVNGYRLHNLNLRINKISNKINFDHLIIVISSSFSDSKSNFYDFPFYEEFNYKFLKATSEILNHILFKYNLKNNYHRKIKENIKGNVANINNLINTLNNTKKKVDVFIVPTIENLNQNKNLTHFIEEIRSSNLNVYNLYEDIKKIKYEDYYFNNAHFNKKGHDYFSKLIYNKLK